MERYRNLGGNSGVSAYEIGDDLITVHFSTGKPYLYSYRSAGRANIENMKVLARKGEGLNSYIKKNVNNKYE